MIERLLLAAVLAAGLFQAPRSTLAGAEADLRPALFLIGDSVTFRIYEHGLLPLCSADSVPDRRTNLSLETLLKVNLTGRACNTTFAFSRVGASFHWGVSPVGPYHVGAGTHRFAQAPAASTDYIQLAAREFSQRVAGERGGIAVVFASCHWDSARYKDNFWDTLPPGEHLREYKANLTAVAASLRAALPPGHRLFLQTTPNGRTSLLRLHAEFHNTIMRAVAREMNLTVIDSAAQASAFTPNSFFHDEIHPTVESARMLAKDLVGTVAGAFVAGGGSG